MGFLFGCERQEPAPSFVKDSAGVHIVQHGSSAAPTSNMRLAQEPDYRVGWKVGDPTFELINSGVLLADGRAVVGDYGSRTLIVLSPSGEIEGVFGGPGQGPGEIGTLKTINRIGGDTIAVEDGLNARISIFHEGSILRTVLTNTSGSIIPRMIAVEGDERGLIMRSSTYNPNFSEPWLQGVVARFDLALDRLDTLRSFDWAPNRATSTQVFRVQGVVSSTGGDILIGRTDRPQIDRFNPDGQLTQILRFPRARKVITEGIWASYKWFFMTEPQSNLGTQGRASLFAQIRWPIGDPLPYFGKLFGDEKGNAWVADFSVIPRTVERFDVFSPAGEWLGSLSLPPLFRVLDIRGGMILGVEIDELWVNAVALYRIEGWEQVS